MSSPANGLRDKAIDDGLLGMLAGMRAALLRYLVARGASAADAEDVLHDVWLTLSEARVGPIAEPRAYLYRAATNRLLDHRRGAVRRGQREQAWVEAGAGGRIDADDRPSPEAQLIARERLAIVEREISRLPPRTADILRRFRVGGETQRAIADDIGISLSAVEKHLQTGYRAVVAAKAALDAEIVAREGAERPASRRYRAEGDDDGS